MTAASLVFPRCERRLLPLAFITYRFAYLGRSTYALAERGLVEVRPVPSLVGPAGYLGTVVVFWAVRSAGRGVTRCG